LDMSADEKASYVAKLAGEFRILAEVGYKDGEKSERLSPSQWVESIEKDLGAGADHVILEARESGSSGICRPDGRLRIGLIEDILRSPVPTDRLIFEAPTKTLQAYFVDRLGPSVNLANIALAEVIGLETLRLGLRADTMAVAGA
ncbi:phosphosulfolactate synthase, partial [Frankia sp. CiP1_Cm_nod2]|uniref:phosphosulfolactate synthase n=1 Tax=Frankia sp. CiP1_Cm_nod2 TaxID=2897161 RepID=UPI002024AEA1